MLKPFQQIVVIMLLGFSVSAFSATGPRVGEYAPGFELTDLSGKSHSLSELHANGPVLLVFWSTKCHVCHAMIPQFKKVHETYKNLTFVAVNVGFEDREEVDDYAFEFKLPYLILNEDDKKADVAQAYRLQGTPTIQLVDTEGKVQFRGHRIPDLKSLIANNN